MDITPPLLALGFATACGLGGALIYGARVWRRRAGTRGASAGPSPEAVSLRQGLATTRRRFGAQLDALLRRSDRAGILGELEEALITADVGVRTSADLVARVREAGTADLTGLRERLAREIAAVFPQPAPVSPHVPPHVVLVTGVNGVGKTTTIGKLAAAAVSRGERVLLVAADTYRAAAIEQLLAWGERLGVEVIRHASGASPSAVAFDGVTAGRARAVDLVLIDTAGRLHTRGPLMDELRKVRRVVGEVCPGAPHETLLVLDATTGQNAVRQAAVFAEAVDVTGIVLTKLDGTAKGGVAIAVAGELGLPIAYVGTGEGVRDLRRFDPEDYASALVSPPRRD